MNLTRNSARLHVLNAARAEIGLPPAWLGDDGKMYWYWDEAGDDDRMGWRAGIMADVAHPPEEGLTWCFACFSGNNCRVNGVSRCITVPDALVYDDHRDVP